MASTAGALGAAPRCGGAQRAQRQLACAGQAVRCNARLSRTARAAPAGRRSVVVLAQSGDDSDKFGRKGNQKALAEIDGATGQAVNQLGSSILNALGPLKNALGIGKGQRVNTGQPSGWNQQRTVLTRAGMKSLGADEAQQLIQKGWVLVDVSPADDYNTFHAQGSVNVPLVRVASGAADVRSALRLAAYSAQGVRAVEENPDFLEQLFAASKDANGVILACAFGGTLRGTVNFPEGQSSRSLMAAARLLQATGAQQATNVAHLRGGLTAWFDADLPGEGTSGEWDARMGKMPSVGGAQYDQDSDELKK